MFRSGVGDLRPITKFMFLMVSGSIGAKVLRAEPIPNLELSSRGLAVLGYILLIIIIIVNPTLDMQGKFVHFRVIF